MKDTTSGTPAKSDTKSPVITQKDELSYLGGLPPKKDVEAIEKVNTPGKAPGSVRG